MYTEDRGGGNWASEIAPGVTLSRAKGYEWDFSRPEAVEHYNATMARSAKNKSRFNKIRNVGLAAIATIATAGIATTYFGAGAAAAAAPAAAPGTVPVGGIGMTVEAALPAYAPQMTAAQGLWSTAPLTSASIGIAAPLSKAAGVVGSAAIDGATVAAVSGVSKLLHPNKDAGMTVEAAMPAYANQIAAARSLDTPTLVAGAVAVLTVLTVLATLR
jgi:hypothetical protein